MPRITYTDKPVFGFDIGKSSMKIMQIDQRRGKARVVGYGAATFDPAAIQGGVIMDFEALASASKQLIEKDMIGSLSTRRVAFAVQNEHCFSRVLSLPDMKDAELRMAVMAEASKAIPIPIENLYISYDVGEEVSGSGLREIQLVATKKEVVDSLNILAEILGLEIALVETNITAVSRLVTHAEDTDIVSLIVDLGSTAADLSIFDDQSIRITSTADCGSDAMTDAIAKKLILSSSQAHIVKSRYGINPSKKQKEILAAIHPELDKLLVEIRKMVRYYSDRTPGRTKSIEQILLLGGGANLPGLSSFITDQIRIAARACDPWQHISFDGMQAPHHLETMLYTTAAGLSLVHPEEISV